MAVLAAWPGVVQAASMEIWPLERRANNTYFHVQLKESSMRLKVISFVWCLPAFLMSRLRESDR